MAETVSVIVPIHNAEKTLGRCVESILAQSYENLEIILVNDGSKDGSLAVCEKFANLDNRVVVVDKKGAGVSAARNAGLKVATGEFVQFVDADDALKPNMTEDLIAEMLASDADVVICGYDRINGKKVQTKCPERFFTDSIFKFKLTFVELYRGAFFNAPWNKLYRSAKITNLFDENVSMGEDLLFNLAYFSNCSKISVINNSIYKYNVSSQNSLAGIYSDDLLCTHIMLNKKVRQFFKNHFDSEDFCKINEVFAKEIYYYLKKLIILSGYDRPVVQKKIKACINHEDVRKMLKNVDVTDHQLKIACTLMRLRLEFLLYLFFKVKGFIVKGGLR